MVCLTHCEISCMKAERVSASLSSYAARSASPLDFLSRGPLCRRGASAQRSGFARAAVAASGASHCYLPFYLTCVTKRTYSKSNL